MRGNYSSKGEAIIEKIMMPLNVIILFFNIFAGLIGAIWLLIAGDWQIVVWGFAVSIIFPFVYVIVVLPLMPLMVLTESLHKKGKKTLRNLVGFIQIFLNNLINLLWVFLIIAFAAGVQDRNVLPFFLFGWMVAIGPFQYMASKEPPDAYGTIFGLYIVCISYLIFMATYYLRIQFLALPLIFVIKILFEIILIEVLNEYDSQPEIL